MVVMAWQLLTPHSLLRRGTHSQITEIWHHLPNVSFQNGKKSTQGFCRRLQNPVPCLDLAQVAQNCPSRSNQLPATKTISLQPMGEWFCYSCVLWVSSPCSNTWFEKCPTILVGTLAAIARLWNCMRFKNTSDWSLDWFQSSSTGCPAALSPCVKEIKHVFPPHSLYAVGFRLKGLKVEPGKGNSHRSLMLPGFLHSRNSCHGSALSAAWGGANSEFFGNPQASF